MTVLTAANTSENSLASTDSPLCTSGKLVINRMNNAAALDCLGYGRP